MIYSLNIDVGNGVVRDNPNYNAACCKRYVASHREEINTYQHKYHHEHLDKCREQNRRCQIKTYNLKKELLQFKAYFARPTVIFSLLLFTPKNETDPYRYSQLASLHRHPNPPAF